MNKALILEPEDLTEADTDALWKQQVNMDDWDYMLLFPAGSIQRDPDEQVFFPFKYTISRLLVGCCDNTWYKNILFRRHRYDIGIAYHA